LARPLTLGIPGSGPQRLVLSNVTKRFDEVVALDRLSFSVAPSQIACLVGPSGCGKTTVLNILAGFDIAYEGEARVGEKRIIGPGPDRTVVFQQDALFPWLSVYKNVVAGIDRRELARGASRDALELLRLVYLEEFRDRYPYQLSGGMRQRAAIARALIRRPSVLLMDEPFGALDAQTRQEMQELLQSAWAAYSPTLVFITHDIDEALILGDVVYVMKARPGSIVDALQVGFPRPRSASIVTSEKFNRMKAQVMDHLKAQRSAKSSAEKVDGLESARSQV
jgi:NitT/TauT family transport system ATP-binding protein